MRSWIFTRAGWLCLLSSSPDIGNAFFSFSGWWMCQRDSARMRAAVLVLSSHSVSLFALLPIGRLAIYQQILYAVIQSSESLWFHLI
mmetsp:Transcript_28203/g.79179  ORF Transcript_28203/g.79179 Transcript_28203/m.79179 type:complete len:87 (+) Transcript_28203:453-713(+)